MNKEKKNTAAKQTRPRCPKCGFRTRGKHHEDGHHHNNGSGGFASKRKY